MRRESTLRNRGRAGIGELRIETNGIVDVGDGLSPSFCDCSDLAQLSIKARSACALQRMDEPFEYVERLCQVPWAKAIFQEESVGPLKSKSTIRASTASPPYHGSSR
jgi:hypothetical protein